MEARCSTRYILEPKTEYKMVAALAAPNDYDKTETLTDEKENPKPKWYTLTHSKMGNPNNGALPLLL